MADIKMLKDTNHPPSHMRSHRRAVLAIIHAITLQHMNTSCGVNGAGVHCSIPLALLAPEPIFWVHLNKKNLQTFVGPFRLMFNLLLLDTVPPGTSFPFLKPALQCHVVRRERGGEN